MNGFADTVVADYFWARAVVLTSPTVATIGMSITIPIALVTDFFINGIAPTAISVVGSLSVIVGFILVNLDHEQQDRITSYLWRLVAGSYHQEDQSSSQQDNPIHADRQYLEEDEAASNASL